MIHRPLKDHYEMETDAGTTWRIFDYANDLEKYADYLEQQKKNLNIPAVSCWVSISETKQYPSENETVWLYNSKNKCVWLGCYVYLPNEGWFWAISNGTIYVKDGKIVSEADIDDDYEITHWCTVPSLPCC